MDELKPGRIVMGESSLEISYPSILPPAEREKAREISDLLTRKGERGNNSANSLMQEVCAQADAHGVLLLLMPQAYGTDGLTTEQLIEWYQRRHGFITLQTTPATILVRMPRAAAQQWAAHEQEH